MAWRIPEAEIERVKRQTDLVALVQSRGIELKRHGAKDWIGRCPFHDDNQTPNFIVTPDKGLWHCMACGQAGNAIQFVERRDGLSSFRHAYEVLAQGGTAAFSQAPTTAPRLPCPLDPEADDVTLFGQVIAYYHERLKQSAPARACLASRGLDDDALMDHFQMGFADRTLGLRLPDKNRKTGELLRTRLTQLGLWRASGHEHFNGCLVVPFHDVEGHAVSLYGRRVQPSEPRHLYPPGPHRGLFNRQCLSQPEIILCEAVLDALTFYVNGFTNVTCLFGTEGFTDELWQALGKVRTVRLAYDADDAGERAAQRDAERFRQHGVEVYRIKFPHGMDANEYACKVKPADKSLALLVNSAVWLGGGARPSTSSQAAAVHKVQAPSASLAAASLAAEPSAHVPTAATTSRSPEPAAKEEKAAPIPELPAPSAALSANTPCLEPRGDHHFIALENREYRVSGLEKTLGTGTLKITLRLRVIVPGSDWLHLDQIDLCRDQERRRFIDRATEETGLATDLLKRDLGRLLLAVEQAQTDLQRALAQPTTRNPPPLTPEEREEALAWLKEPNLLERLRQAFHQAGIIGEENNTLVAYLACVSRKLERPLAIIIQSASAAGKTTLMDAVLSFFPEEERVKYSAMTGQSLYYLGETNLQHKILAVVEEAGAEKASYALKLLQSEGELTIASTGKDPQTGKMITQEYHVQGPVMIFLTTTAIDLDEELQNRCLTLAVDESAEQTERIHRVQRERRTLAGLLAREERQDLLRKLRNAQRLLQPMNVLNPYAPELIFPAGRTRNRRDHEKYLTLIDAIALLHQYQRPRGQVLAHGHQVNGRAVEFIEVTLEDIALANQLAPEVLGRSLDELPPQTRRLLGQIRELVKNKRTGSAASGAGGRAQAPARAGGAATAGSAATFSRKELREASGWSLTQVRLHLERLVELECVAIRHGRLGSQFVYELLLDPAVPEAAAHVGLIDVEKLRHRSNNQGASGAATLAGLERGVAGQNGHLAGVGENLVPPATALAAVT